MFIKTTAFFNKLAQNYNRLKVKRSSLNNDLLTLCNLKLVDEKNDVSNMQILLNTTSSLNKGRLDILAVHFKLFLTFTFSETTL